MKPAARCGAPFPGTIDDPLPPRPQPPRCPGTFHRGRRGQPQGSGAMLGNPNIGHLEVITPCPPHAERMPTITVPANYRLYADSAPLGTDLYA